MNVELEYTLSYIQTFYQNVGCEHTLMWPLSLSYRQTNRLPWVDITFQLVLLAWGILRCTLSHCPSCHTVPISPLLHCPPLPHGAALSTPAKSTLATWCRIVYSCIVHPCHIMPICPLLYFPHPHFLPCRFVHSRKFHQPVFLRNSDQKLCIFLIVKNSHIHVVSDYLKIFIHQEW